MLHGGAVANARASDSAPSDDGQVASPEVTPPRAPTREATRLPRRAATPSSTQTPGPVQTEGAEQLLREYEIRLAAHRRELLERESELEVAKRRIAELDKVPPQASPSAAIPATVGSGDDRREDPVAVSPTPYPPPAPVSRGDDSLAASLQRELDVERENRATLEQEIQRLVSASSSPQELHALTQSLDGARAQILLLNQRLADEQRAREALEVSVERVRSAAGVAPGSDWIERFEATMRERRAQAERLQEELHNANEAIVELKSKVEGQGDRPPEAAPVAAPIHDTRELEEEITKLREALRNAQQANAALRTQSELAGRLADMLYSQSR